MSRALHVALIVLALAVGLAPSAGMAQSQGGQRFEVATIASINIVSIKDYDDVMALTVPAYVPGLRVTIWPSDRLLIDLGASIAHARGGDDIEATTAMIEGGFGVDFGKKGAKSHPYAGFLVGSISVSASQNSDKWDESEMYFGAQIGARQYIRDYAATRIFAAYRKIGGDFGIGLIELGVGLSFFL